MELNAHPKKREQHESSLESRLELCGILAIGKVLYLEKPWFSDKNDKYSIFDSINWSMGYKFFLFLAIASITSKIWFLKRFRTVFCTWQR